MIRTRLVSGKLACSNYSLFGRRFYRVLALESSCDDACVALLDKYSADRPPRVIDQVRKTLNSAQAGGVIPTEAHGFHQFVIGNIVSEFCEKHNLNSETPPDLICCTRGPGMVGSLSASLQLAKGLSIAWKRPLIGVHHMLGHVLIANLPKSQQPGLPGPQYPFLSLLCSGGHTMLVLSKSLTDHEIIINTVDIAAGDSLDKCARELGLVGNMLGKELEQYVDNIPDDLKKEFSLIKVSTKNNEFGFQLSLPLRSPKHQKVPDTIQFSFASFLSAIISYKNSKATKLDERTKKFIAFKLQETLFDHLINRINIAIQKHGNKLNHGGDGKFEGVFDFICSGGVASNKRLREKLFNDINYKTNLTLKLNFHFPDLSLCTDNAIMIGVAGIEIFEKLKKKSDLSILPIRKWPMDKLLDVDGWVTISDDEFNKIRNSCK